ncbi:MAG: iron-sulfur cluster assembly protein [Bacteroidales bacterium]|nr:iron-sulfur cluster assembly protein [Bacteroidales bacterium]MCF8390676.1 iron-sulfur cluster assembly protein [Bacteroidales bacterium]
MSERTILDIESDIILTLKNIYDPEIPVNIYELGLIYEIDVQEDFNVVITMTLTTPNCPVADSLLEDVRDQVGSVKSVKKATVNLTFDPPWDQEMLSDEAKLDLGLL